MGVKGRIAIVTGGARGIGHGIAMRLAQDGARVLLVDRLGDQLPSAMAELPGPGAHAQLCLDLLEPDAPDRIAAAALESFGRIDILINNAGVAISGTIEQFTDAEWDRTLAINLTAPFRLARKIVPIMAAQGYGRVVNISSMNGRIGMRSDTAYAVTKAGLEALTRSIAVDYGVCGVTANAVAPGTIETPLNSDILKKWGDESPLKQIVLLNKPVPGNGDVGDIAAAAAYLASDEAKYISGQVIVVDGGLSATRFVPDRAGAAVERFA